MTPAEMLHKRGFDVTELPHGVLQVHSSDKAHYVAVTVDLVAQCRSLDDLSAAIRYALDAV